MRQYWMYRMRSYVQSIEMFNKSVLRTIALSPLGNMSYEKIFNWISTKKVLSLQQHISHLFHNPLRHLHIRDKKRGLWLFSHSSELIISLTWNYSHLQCVNPVHVKAVHLNFHRDKSHTQNSTKSHLFISMVVLRPLNYLSHPCTFTSLLSCHKI